MVASENALHVEHWRRRGINVHVDESEMIAIYYWSMWHSICRHMVCRNRLIDGAICDWSACCAVT